MAASAYYALLADLLVALHVAVVGFVLVGEGGILLGGALRWSWVRRASFRIVHLVSVVFIGATAALGELCPLTVWEYELRMMAGEGGHPGSFVGRFLHGILYVDVPLTTLAVIYVVFAVLVVATLFLVPVQWRRSPVVDSP